MSFNVISRGESEGAKANGEWSKSDFCLTTLCSFLTPPARLLWTGHVEPDTAIEAGGEKQGEVVCSIAAIDCFFCSCRICFRLRLHGGNLFSVTLPAVMFALSEITMAYSFCRLQTSHLLLNLKEQASEYGLSTWNDHDNTCKWVSDYSNHTGHTQQQSVEQMIA